PAGVARAAPSTSRTLAPDVPTAVAAVEGSVAPARPARPTRAEIAAVEVDLVIRRGGERRADGARIRTGGAWVEGVARYTLAAPGTVRPGAKAGAKPRRKPDQVIVVGGDGASTPYASVFFGPAWVSTDRHRLGMDVKVRSIHRRPSGQVPNAPKGAFLHDIAG